MPEKKKRQGPLVEVLKSRGYRKKTFLFPETLHNKLIRQAKKERRTETAVVLIALERYFTQTEGGTS